MAAGCKFHFILFQNFIATILVCFSFRFLLLLTYDLPGNNHLNAILVLKVTEPVLHSDRANLAVSMFTHLAMRSASVFLALITDTGSASLDPLYKNIKQTDGQKCQTRFLFFQKTAIDVSPGTNSLLYLRSRWWAPPGMFTAMSDELKDLRTYTGESSQTQTESSDFAVYCRTVVWISYPSVCPWVQISIGENNVASSGEHWIQVESLLETKTLAERYENISHYFASEAVDISKPSQTKWI